MVARDDPTPPRGRRGLTFKVLVHLDLIKSPPDDYGDDDDGRGWRNNKGRHWGAHLFRSLSRAPARDREWERSRSRHGVIRGTALTATTAGDTPHMISWGVPVATILRLQCPPRHGVAPGKGAAIITEECDAPRRAGTQGAIYGASTML